MDKSTSLPKIKGAGNARVIASNKTNNSTVCACGCGEDAPASTGEGGMCALCNVLCSVQYAVARVVCVQSTGDSKLREIEVLPDNEGYGNCFRPLELALVHR